MNTVGKPDEVAPPLDRLDLWNLVLFLDKLPADPRQFITAVRRAGTLAAPHGLLSP